MERLDPQFRPLNWKGNYPFYIYCLSTLFILFFSIHAIHFWASVVKRSSIILATLIPPLALFLKKYPSWSKDRKLPREILVSVVIVFLGVINVILSEDQWASFKGMGLFLLSGVSIFGTTFIILKSKANRSFYFYLCSTLLFILSAYGLYEYFLDPESVNNMQIFSANKIPAGSLLILLSIGPMILLTHAKSRVESVSLWAILLLSWTVIVLMTQRGPILALIVMFIFFGFLKTRKFWIYFLVLIFLLAAGYQFKESLPERYQNKLSLKGDGIRYRLEAYPASLNLIKAKPLFGVGWNAPLTNHLERHYKGIFAEPVFYWFIHHKKTFDSMALAFLTETGIIFTTIYAGCLFLISYQFFLKSKRNPEARTHAILMLTVLTGFGVHSMTFDSLKYPDLNWVFHSLLGMMASYNADDNETGSFLADSAQTSDSS